MTRERFIRKWLSNNAPYNEHFKDMMRNDLDSVIEFHNVPKKDNTHISNNKYRRCYEELQKWSEPNFSEIYKLKDWHFRVVLDSYKVDIYPKKKKYCVIWKDGIRNKWGGYEDLTTFLNNFFELN